MPAAPFVGAVTTWPPAAFSSLTANAKTLTQSSACMGLSRIAAHQLTIELRRAPAHAEHARQQALRVEAARTQSCMTCQIRISRARMSASLYQVRSRASISS